MRLIVIKDLKRGLQDRLDELHQSQDAIKAKMIEDVTKFVLKEKDKPWTKGKFPFRKIATQSDLIFLSASICDYIINNEYNLPTIWELQDGKQISIPCDGFLNSDWDVINRYTHRYRAATGSLIDFLKEGIVMIDGILSMFSGQKDDEYIYIPEKTLEKIYHRFYRYDAYKRKI